jgi:hypothetical protein
MACQEKSDMQTKEILSYRCSKHIKEKVRIGANVNIGRKIVATTITTNVIDKRKTEGSKNK